MGSSRKGLWRTVWSEGVEPHEAVGKVLQVETANVDETQRKRKCLKRCQTPQILQAGSRLIQLLGCKHVLTFTKKEG